MKKPPTEKYNLVCIAHPDDESIFLGGTIQRLQKYPWRIICLTDGNADGRGGKRKKDFTRACKALKAKDFQWWGYPDIYEQRLPIADIIQRLHNLPRPHSIYTHGPLGEYGHPHHQDACKAVHTAFEGHERIYSISYNTFPEVQIELTNKEFNLKTKILSEIYGEETSRFLNLLPATSTEGLVRLKPREVHALYDYLSSSDPNKKLNTRALVKYKWMANYISKYRNKNRNF